MTRPRLLDLFCCEGGAALGYHAAGFDVVGVDIKAQPRYPYEFHRGDALEFLADHAGEFDVVHASPPCQAYSVTRHTHSNTHPDLVAPTRAALNATGLPWVMENVVGAPFDHPIMLCGAAFGLTATDTDGTRMVLRRHRLFESNVFMAPTECLCNLYRDRGYRVAGVYGGGGQRNRPLGTYERGGYTPPRAGAQALLGVTHMTNHGMSQCIPPAYTEYVGEWLWAAIQPGSPTPGT